MSNTEGFIIAEDLTDVMNSYPIGADGEEESVKIIDKLGKGMADDYVLTTGEGIYKDFKDKWYVMPTQQSVTGLIVNKPLLESYELEIPLTTGDLLNCFDVITDKK